MSDKHIEAKPTQYRGVQFKSRLEARWAAFFDYYHLINEWLYEPTTLTLLEKGWEFTPDFRITFGGMPLMVEVKPTEVTEEHHYLLETFGARLKATPLLLVVGDFYNMDIRGEYLTHPSKFSKLSQVFPKSEEAAEIARNYRFDIPYTPPAFRRGSPGEFQAQIARQQSILRKEKRRKK